MSYKTLEHCKMLQQRKLAWTDRRKKPKSEMGPGKHGGMSGKGSSYPTNQFHKTSNYRQHEASKTSCCDITSSSLAMKGTSGGGRAVRKNALAQSQFLPPIMAMTAESSLSMQSKQSSTLVGETLSRGAMDSVGWRSDVYPKDQEKENQQSTSPKDVSSPGSPLGCGIDLRRSVNLLTGSWEQKTFVVKELDDFIRPPMKNAQIPDLYKSCLLVLSSTRGGEKQSNVQQVPGILRRSVGRSQRCLSLKKTSRRDFTTWRNYVELKMGTKGGEKQSSGDSAFGTDTCSENAEVDIELGLEMSKVEMDCYTQQRIINWILQVNAALFTPHTADYLKCPLIEQGTSIKIVYDGD